MVKTAGVALLYAFRLAPLKDPIKYASISGSHSNQALRLWIYGCTHAGSALSPDQLLQRDPCYYDAITKGCSWEIVSHLVPQEFVNFIPLAQSAANASGQIQQAETELQLCRRMRSMFKPTGEIPSYDEVAPVILRSHPPNPLVVPSLWKFMIRFAGGPQGSLMQGTESFVRSNGNAGKNLGVQMWDALCSEGKHQNQAMTVLWRQALIKTSLCHPEKLLSAADIRKSLTSKELFPKIEAFEALLVKLRQHGNAFSDLAPHVIDRGLGVFEVDSVMTIMKKSKGSDGSFDKHDMIEEAASKCHEFWQTMSSKSVTNPWQQHHGGTAAASSQLSTSTRRIGLHFACQIICVHVCFPVSSVAWASIYCLFDTCMHYIVLPFIHSRPWIGPVTLMPKANC